MPDAEELLDAEEPLRQIGAPLMYGILPSALVGLLATGVNAGNL